MTMALHRTFALLAFLLAGCSQGRLDVVGLAPNSLGDGMVAHWPCDEGSGATLGDVPRHKFDGTILGTTWLLDSGHPGFGGALHFDSGNSVIVESEFPPASRDWSVSLWVRPGAWASSPPASGSGGDTYVTLISTEIAVTGGWEMNVRFPGSAQDQPIWRYNFAYPNPADAGPWWYYQWAEAYTVDVGVWTHLVGVVDTSATKVLLYKNGVLTWDANQERPITSTILSGSVALYMGRWSGVGRYFVGDLDDIVIYSRALTADEVALLYKQPAPTVLH
jgi:hypothetical protein